MSGTKRVAEPVCSLFPFLSPLPVSSRSGGFLSLPSQRAPSSAGCYNDFFIGTEDKVS